MGFKYLEINMPTDYTDAQLESGIGKKLKIKEFTYTIDKKSLDARKKNNIHWKLKVGVQSRAIKGKPEPQAETLDIPHVKGNKTVVVVGSGPAGFFAAYTLQTAGFNVTMLERGSQVGARYKALQHFEKTGEFNAANNYAFGEGGAGTFSDGKLTSRTKTISKERRFIFDTYIQCGAPPEIAYLAHPHLGSNNLRKMTVRLREAFMEKGGTIAFDTPMENLSIKNGRVDWLEAAGERYVADYYVLAAGHSAFETYGMMMRAGVPFRTKPFALGCRAEHHQRVINEAQWGCGELPGVKAAEYRLTHKNDAHLPVYSFCMCPGGKVVPAAPYENTNIVNGMSDYSRNSPFANAAVVAGIRMEQLLGKPSEVRPQEALEHLQYMEEKVHEWAKQTTGNGYAAPACRISDFIARKTGGELAPSSYPFPLSPADFSYFLPAVVMDSLREGLSEFCRKLKGYDTGVLMGLESKTSAPVQAIREPGGRSAAVENLYLCGEGAGYAGGIISSAADGIKCALAVIEAQSAI